MLCLIEAYAVRSKDWVVFSYILLPDYWVTEFLRMETIGFPFEDTFYLGWYRLDFIFEVEIVYEAIWFGCFYFFSRLKGVWLLDPVELIIWFFLLFQRSWRLLESRPISWMQDKFDYVEPWSTESLVYLGITPGQI